MTADLDALLATAATSGDPASGRLFTEALLEATVGCLLLEGTGGRRSPVAVPHPDGDGTAVAFFTTPAKTRQAAQIVAKPGLHEQAIACRELFAQAVRNNASLVLNPFSPQGKAFTVAEMSDLLAGVDPSTRARVLPADTELRVGEPAFVAPGLVEGLSEYLRGLGGVDSASLAWVAYPDGMHGYLLVVRTALPRETVVAGIDESASRTDGRTLDVLVVAPGGNDPAHGVPSFYSRT